MNKVKHTSLSRNTGDSIAGKAYTATGYIATEEVEEYFEEEEVSRTLYRRFLRATNCCMVIPSDNHDNIYLD